MYFFSYIFAPDEAREVCNIALRNYCLMKLHLRCVEIVPININKNYIIIDRAKKMADFKMPRFRNWTRIGV